MNNLSHGHPSPLTQGSSSSSDSNSLSDRTLNVGVGRAREAQNETDPIRRIWDALNDAGCKPHGPHHQFRADCPVHDSDATLSVGEGSDGRVLLDCKSRHCDARAITDALSLRLRDLFPAGHRNGDRRKPTQPTKPRALNAGAAFLDALMLAGFNWRAMVVLPKCPWCDNDRALLWVHAGGHVEVDCPDGCHAEDVRRAVETRAAIAEKTNERSAA